MLEDGRRFYGRSFGAEGRFTGEVVFNTSLCGYQEILTDPSYQGQFLTFTMPLIGIYGVNQEDQESARVHAAGAIVRECSRRASSWRASGTLPDYLKAQGKPGIEGIDTRALVLHIRERGAMNGIIATGSWTDEELRAELAAAPSMVGLDLAKVVTCSEPYRFDGAIAQPTRGFPETPPESVGRVVVVDFGVKRSILHCLRRQGVEVEVVPAMTPVEAILERAPDGLLLSNGPGDPEPVKYGIELARALRERLPMMGICLGHQILGLSFGAKSYKMKFGHRGGNHPVRDEETGKVSITSQNHGFAIDRDSMPDDSLVVTHTSLNDGTIEGLRHKELPLFSVQFHPEAGPGPHDAVPLFERFVALVQRSGAPIDG